MINDFAERVESAANPDRELDAAISSTLGWTDVRFDRAHGGYWEHDPKDSFEVLRSVPLYTASLDSAMTLVPEGYVVGALNQRTRYDIAQAIETSVDLNEQAAWMAWVHVDTNDRTFRIGRRFSHHGYAATPALALTAAALRARAHLTAGATHDR